MKVLILNQDWFAEELRSVGHDVVVAGLSTHLQVVLSQPLLHIDSVISCLPDNFRPEVIVWLDNSAPPLFVGLEECDIPIVFYSVDTHHHVELHSYLAQIFDHVLLGQKDYISRFQSCGTPVSWFPLWASRYVDKSDDKQFDSAFVGNLNAKLNPDRVMFFDKLKSLVPIHIAHGEYWKIFPHSEIVVNQTVKGDLNFRVFETMMCGSLLLTEASGNGLDDLFEDGRHLVLYEKGNPNDAAAKIRDLLADKPRLRKIAQCGREEILAHHTPEARSKELIRIVEGVVKRNKSPLKYFATMTNFGVVSLLIERADPSVCSRALVAALTAAEKALQCGEIPGEIESGQMIICAIRYDRFLRSRAGQKLIDSFSEGFPDNPLFQLASIRGFLNGGDRTKAEQLARRISLDSPESIFAAAEHAISTLLAATND